jgi:hypothetical protein
MRRLAGLALLAVAACAQAPAKPIIHGQTPGHSCKTDGTDQFIGKTRSQRLEGAIRRVSNAAVLRWAPPGIMLTMDYRADRVTVWVDSSGKVTQLKCG